MATILFTYQRNYVRNVSDMQCVIHSVLQNLFCIVFATVYIFILIIMYVSCLLTLSYMNEN